MEVVDAEYQWYVIGMIVAIVGLHGLTSLQGPTQTDVLLRRREAY